MQSESKIEESTFRLLRIHGQDGDHAEAISKCIPD